MGLVLTPLNLLAASACVAEWNHHLRLSWHRDLPGSPRRREASPRELFDGGIGGNVAVARLALAPSVSASWNWLLYGSAPEPVSLEKRGKGLLFTMTLLEKAHTCIAPDYGPKTACFLPQ
jgi:hypothetical protein